MKRTNKSLIAFCAVVVMVAGWATGCGGNDQESAEQQQSENVTHLQSQLRDLPYIMEFAPDSKTDLNGPGIVSGRATSRTGVAIDFTFSIGPDPKKLPGKGGSWISGGDQFYLRTGETPKGYTKKELQEQDNMYLDLEDAGCQVVIGKPCPV